MFASVNNQTIRGELTTAGVPCYSTVCPTLLVFTLTNESLNPSKYYLKTNDNYVEDMSPILDCNVGDELAFYGYITTRVDSSYNDVYEFNILHVLKDTTANNFTSTYYADCGTAPATEPKLSIENDSLIIEYIKEEQCAPNFVLWNSEIITDTMFVLFQDTSTVVTTCVCTFSVRIAVAIPSGTDNLNVYYNGKVYTATTTAIKEESNSNISIYPNPTDGIIMIDGLESRSSLSYEVYDLEGRFVKKGKIPDSSINLTNDPGVYVVVIKENDEVLVKRNIIVE